MSAQKYMNKHKLLKERTLASIGMFSEFISSWDRVFKRHVAINPGINNSGMCIKYILNALNAMLTKRTNE